MDTLEIQLMEAVRNRNVEIVQSILKRRCMVDRGDEDDLTPLHVAAWLDYVEIAQLLINYGANVNCKTICKMTPLHHAALKGLDEMVAVLVHGGAELDPLDFNDNTPLMLAITRNHKEVVEALVVYGARINMEKIHGYTPLYDAVMNHRADTVALLMKAGAVSQCLLHHTVKKLDLPTTEVLLKYGASPSQLDEKDYSPLLVAITNLTLQGNVFVKMQLIKLLLEYEAMPNDTSSHETIILKALSVKATLFEELLSLLCLHGLDLNKNQPCTVNPLASALKHNQIEHAVALIRAGADVNHADVYCLWGRISRSSIFRSDSETGILLRYITTYVIASNDSERDFIPRIDDMRPNYNYLDSVWCVEQRNKMTGFSYLFFAAGYDVAGNITQVFEDLYFQRFGKPLPGWVTYYKSNPRSLTDLCRIALRSHMGSRALHTIPTLPIPDRTKEFLLYRDINVKYNT